jgi:hypothetical protein
MEREKINFQRLMLDGLKVESGWRGKIGEINIGKKSLDYEFSAAKVKRRNKKSQVSVLSLKNSGLFPSPPPV